MPGAGQDLDHSGSGYLGPSESACATAAGDGERLVLAMHMTGRGLCPVISAVLETLDSIPWARHSQDHCLSQPQFLHVEVRIA